MLTIRHGSFSLAVLFLLALKHLFCLDLAAGMMMNSSLMFFKTWGSWISSFIVIFIGFHIGLNFLFFGIILLFLLGFGSVTWSNLWLLEDDPWIEEISFWALRARFCSVAGIGSRGESLTEIPSKLAFVFLSFWHGLSKHNFMVRQLWEVGGNPPLTDRQS